MDLMISTDAATIQIIEQTKTLVVNLKVKLTSGVINNIIEAIKEATGLRDSAVLEYEIKIV